VRWQENNSFAPESFRDGLVSAGAVCPDNHRDVVLCVGRSLIRFPFLSFCSKITAVGGFYSLVPNMLINECHLLILYATITRIPSRLAKEIIKAYLPKNKSIVSSVKA